MLRCLRKQRRRTDSAVSKLFVDMGIRRAQMSFMVGLQALDYVPVLTLC
jgi:hypothetical protein